MKHIKEVLLVGLIVFGGLFLKASGSIGQNDYKKELRDRKVKVEEYLQKVDGVEKEFVEKYLSHEDQDGIVEIREITNTVTGESYKKIHAEDSVNKISIDGRLDGTIFFRRGNQRFWIDTNRKNYFTDNFDYSKNSKEDSIISINESMIYEKFLAGYDKKIEKLENGYKVTSLDDLNKGSYDIYDEYVNLIESFTDNSQGKWKDELISKTENVEEVFNKLMDMKDTYKKVDDIGQIKN